MFKQQQLGGEVGVHENLVFSLFSGTKRKAEERRGAGGKAGAGSIIMGGPVSFMLQ